MKRKREKYKPYGLDLVYEWKTYKHIGLDYGNRKTANKGMIRNISRFLRRITNKNEKKYAFCNTYSEWKTHVKNILPQKKYCNYDDMLKWLEDVRNSAESYLDAIKSVLIPFYVAFFSMYEIFITDKETNKTGAMIIILVIVVFASTVILYGAMNKAQFYKDFFDVVDKIKDE